jgi:hypothetical protein
MRLLVAWVEGERQRRRFPLPRRIGDPALRGWVHVVVCVVGGILVVGLCLCLQAEAWHRAGRMFRREFVGCPVTVEGVRVGMIARHVKADGGTGPLTLIVWSNGLLMACEFSEEKAPEDIRVGDTINIRSAAGWRDEEWDRILLKDCEVIGGPSRPEE